MGSSRAPDRPPDTEQQHRRPRQQRRYARFRNSLNGDQFGGETIGGGSTETDVVLKIQLAAVRHQGAGHELDVANVFVEAKIRWGGTVVSGLGDGDRPISRKRRKGVGDTERAIHVHVDVVPGPSEPALVENL